MTSTLQYVYVCGHCSQAKDAVDVFMCRCQAAFYQLLQVTGHNRARQRQKLEMALADLAGVQEEVRAVSTADVSGWGRMV